jgi:hypothetical protein
MAFVHGHPRDSGWVKSHRRRPNQAEGGQLPLMVDGSPEGDVEGRDRVAAQDGSEVAGRSPPGPDVSSSRNSAITRS